MSRSRVRRALAAAALVGALAGASVVVSAVAPNPSVDGPGSSTDPAVRVDPPDAVLVVGDSAISAIRWVPGASSAVLGTDYVTLDLESCRRLVTTSCSGREGRRPPTALAAVRAAGDRYRTVVIATGYNDSSATFRSDFRTIVDAARANGVDRIVWYTPRVDVGYVPPGGGGGYQAVYAAMNAILFEELATGRYPDVVVADWDRYSRGRSTWFASDGVHYTTLGAWVAADYLSRTLAFLDGRPCPLPVSPGVPVQDPCPDPDETGPIADVAALYPIGQPGVLCYELGEDRTYVCRSSSSSSLSGTDAPEVAAFPSGEGLAGSP